MVILMPALFAVMFLGMQAALIYHARTLAIASAQEGARAAGAENSTTAAGISTARTYLAETAGDAPDLLHRHRHPHRHHRHRHGARGRAQRPARVTPAITQSASVTVERITRSTGPGRIGGGTSHV